MTYQEAITAIKNGSTVKRHNWSGKTVKKETSGENTYIGVTETKTIRAPYLFSQEDMFASDWETV